MSKGWLDGKDAMEVGKKIIKSTSLEKIVRDLLMKTGLLSLALQKLKKLGLLEEFYGETGLIESERLICEEIREGVKLK